MHAQKALNLRPAELVQRQASGELWRILDVREPWEIAIAALPEAVTIPMRDVPRKVSELNRITKTLVEKR